MWRSVPPSAPPSSLAVLMSSWRALLRHVLLAILLSSSLLLVTAQWDSSANMVALEDASWRPMELMDASLGFGAAGGGAGNAFQPHHATQSFERQLSDADLFHVLASTTGSSSSTGPEEDPVSGSTGGNDEPLSLVRSLCRLSPAPSLLDLQGFKDQFIQDLSTVLDAPVACFVVRSVSNNNGQTTVVWDTSVPISGGTRRLLEQLTAQELYDKLVSLPQSAFDPTVYLKLVEMDSFAQLCEDGQYRRDCDAQDDEDGQSKIEQILPWILIAAGVVFLILLAVVIYACVRWRRARRRRGSANSLKLAAPPLHGADLVPAKKFVYTAPNSHSGAAEPVSEVTIMARGEDFEPSVAHSVVHSRSGLANPRGVSPDSLEEGANKNRLAARFPTKSPASDGDPTSRGSSDGRASSDHSSGGSSGASSGALGDTPATDIIEKGKSASISGHHFYYVDGGKTSASSGVHSTRRGSRNSSGIVFSMGDGSGSRNELSHSSGSHSQSSRSHSGSSHSVPGTPASDQRRRRGSAPHAVPDTPLAATKAPMPAVEAASVGGVSASSVALEKDKAALPVVRPGQK